jgi:hypothetical protein
MNTHLHTLWQRLQRWREKRRLQALEKRYQDLVHAINKLNESVIFKEMTQNLLAKEMHAAHADFLAEKAKQYPRAASMCAHLPAEDFVKVSTAKNATNNLTRPSALEPLKPIFHKHRIGRAKVPPSTDGERV